MWSVEFKGIGFADFKLGFSGVLEIRTAPLGSLGEGAVSEAD